MVDRNFREASYTRHKAQYEKFAEGGDKVEHARTWLEKDTVGYWCHRRLHEMLDPLLEAFPDAGWLTVGDGRFGVEAQYILSKGVRAVASDISDTLLKESHSAGYIKEFSRQNAERLSFSDSEFDFVLCKETYHHFPRPMVALYEMLRVAGKGVVLIEPTDPVIGATVRWKLFRSAVNMVRRATGEATRLHQFEESGNYVYTISRREVEKVALGLGLPTVAFRDINTFYSEGVENEKAQDGNRVFKKVRRRIKLNDIFCSLGLKPPVKTCAVIFKTKPEQQLREKLESHHFTVIDLPENPYL